MWGRGGQGINIYWYWRGKKGRNYLKTTYKGKKEEILSKVYINKIWIVELDKEKQKMEYAKKLSGDRISIKKQWNKGKGRKVLKSSFLVCQYSNKIRT